jgi:hypothetical protein
LLRLSGHRLRAADRVRRLACLPPATRLVGQARARPYMVLVCQRASFAMRQATEDVAAAKRNATESTQAGEKPPACGAGSSLRRPPPVPASLTSFTSNVPSFANPMPKAVYTDPRGCLLWKPVTSLASPAPVPNVKRASFLA